MLRLFTTTSRRSKFVLNVARRSLSSFPYKTLNLSLSTKARGGYYHPATIHEKLNGDKYKIVRKIGYGPRSTTWLVSSTNYSERRYVAKIFTLPASERANTVELPISKAVNKLSSFLNVPTLYDSFWVESSAGSHLCILTDEFGSSIQDFQRDADNQRLPVHAVQKIVSTVSEVLEGLHNAKIMHGGIKPENILFPTPEDEPEPFTLRNIDQTTVVSESNCDFKWNDRQKIVVDWPLYLDNFEHAQRSHYKPEEKGDYSSAPETLLQRASCSPRTDIWMLGCMAYNLLTGKALFHSSNSTSKQIALMRATLRDNVPKRWLSDNKMKDYNAEDHGSAISIEAGLLDVLDKDEARRASAFIKGCLRLDPRKRRKAWACKDHEWLSDADACSCMFH